MHKPKMLDTNAVNEINSRLYDNNRSFIVFWEYYPYRFIESNYSGIFLECVLALYRLYVDCGGNRLKYCFDQHRHGHNNELAKMQRHYNNICNLRTLFCHNLYLSSSCDKDTLDRGTSWLKNVCGEDFPTTEVSWKKCYDNLVIEADSFYNLLDSRMNWMITGINRRILLEEVFKWYSDNFPEKLLYSAVSGVLKDNNLRWAPSQIKELIGLNLEKWREIYKNEILSHSNPYMYLLSLISDVIF